MLNRLVEEKNADGILEYAREFHGHVCPYLALGIRASLVAMEELGVEPIGLSVDQVFSHLKWMEWIKENLGEDITFPVIADDRGELADKLGMIPSGATITARAVFIVDDKGVIRAIVYYPAEVGRDWDEILRLVKALKTSDEKGVALPHKWPNNELIGDRAIVPPAGSVDQIKEREEAKAKGEIECYDWWFCYKKLE
ncbi:peroxiredoxin [Thermococcus stetteri]|uniref:peroxiredoxin n=1 Tax=Thermococcus stetteri TaxID=49900 RepID=UPI001FD761D9|nr:peroxiredoxin [Thermococcus stetteri]MBP1912143.1 peroxiredoxin (alkyl hydroperoxide reductase subunit C) [Thermococcus stetteri]